MNALLGVPDAQFDYTWELVALDEVIVTPLWACSPSDRRGVLTNQRARFWRSKVIEARVFIDDERGVWFYGHD